MKNLEEIKNEVAIKNNYGKYWVNLSSDEKALLTDEVAEEHAKQCCQTQIVNCTINLNIDYPKGTEKYSDAVNSILETPNVVNK